jgi:hypothetical protein
MTAESITLRDLADMAKRELAYRRFVYPNRIEAGKMSAAKAAREIALMEEAFRRFDAEAKAEEAQWSLDLALK